MEEQNIPGKGEARLAPEDIDVIDNLIEAQAAYMEALQTCGVHLKMQEVPEEIVSPLRIGMAGVAGYFIMAFSERKNDQ